VDPLERDELLVEAQQRVGDRGADPRILRAVEDPHAIGREPGRIVDEACRRARAQEAASSEVSGPAALPFVQSSSARVMMPSAQSQGPAPMIPAPATSFEYATWYCVAM
jgi:hypothetical protein